MTPISSDSTNSHTSFTHLYYFRIRNETVESWWYQGAKELTQTQTSLPDDTQCSGCWLNKVAPSSELKLMLMFQPSFCGYLPTFVTVGVTCRHNTMYRQRWQSQTNSSRAACQCNDSEFNLRFHTYVIMLIGLSRISGLGCLGVFIWVLHIRVSRKLMRRVKLKQIQI